MSSAVESFVCDTRISPQPPAALGGKIAYLVNQYPYPSGTFIRREIEAMESLGFEVFRYSLRQTNVKLAEPKDLIESSKTRIVLSLGLLGLIGSFVTAVFSRPVRMIYAIMLTLRVGWRSDRGLGHNFAYLLEACQLVKWLEEDGIDHVHAHYGTNSATVAMLCHELGGPQYSFTAHGPDEFDKPQRLHLGEKVARSKFAVAISEYGRSQLYRWTKYKHWHKIQVVHCGLDRLFLETKLTPPPSDRRLVFIGRLAEQKGTHVLVAAAEQLKDEGCEFELMIVGDGPMRTQLQELINLKGLEENVLLVGWRNDREVQQILLGSRALVMASFAEGLPVVIMESLAMGRPVISTNVAGVAELVQPGVCGWLVPAGAVQPLAEKMREALDMPLDLLEEYGRRGAALVAARHDASREAAKLAEMIAATEIN
jgi:colanic acid/amylovoran biosynthesis glycosyltransferase